MPLKHVNISLPRIEDFIEESSLDMVYEDYITEAGRNPVIEPNPREADIVRAITKRRYVGFYYAEDDDEAGVKSGFRLVEPYVFGHGYKKGSDVSNPTRGYLRGFVVKSSKTDRNEKLERFNRKSVSKTERRPYWRLFRFDRIQSFQMFPVTIPAARYRYNPDDKMINSIVVSGEYKTKRVK